MSYEPSEKIGTLTPAEATRFLGEPWTGRIATIGPDGWPYVAPVWYEFEPDRRSFLVVGRERARWIAHIRVEPRVAFHVADDLHAHHTRVQVQATARILEGDDENDIVRFLVAVDDQHPSPRPEDDPHRRPASL